ncbi:TLD-domain-containing protein [Pluteus cervinus]|uniref:TLD-domain-containing protein n=1 Tax=Pluteus cervinus TaxID=181527 RepID=A0ACD3A3W8_9AGAR|nr:TLD-domain-containing protein [Pluteus cervinus]
MGTTQDFSTTGRILDKFATLFSPATPRASPTLDPIQPPSTSSKRTSIYNPNPPISATDSEFGAFVAIPATEDPLAAPIIDFAESPVQPAFSKVRPKSWTSSEPFSNRNPSLTFFDKFAQDAKVASNRKGYLEELLLNEQDPLAFLTTPSSFEPLVPTNAHTSGLSGLSLSKETTPHQSKAATPTPDSAQRSQPHLTASPKPSTLSELDVEFFTNPSKASPAVPQPQLPAPSESPPRTSPTRSPKRSPTRPTLAPPLSSSPTITRTDPLSGPDIRRPTLSGRSSSYHTLSNLSSRWMTSILPSTNPTTTSRHNSKSSLEALFAAASEGSRPLQAKFTTGLGLSFGTTTTPSSAAGADSTHHHQAVPAPVPSSAKISHGTPFGSSSTTSPFASHTYIPPSGAPGFKGEGYDWDKGYSNELEREIMMDSEEQDQGQHQHVRGRQPGGEEKELKGINVMKGGYKTVIGIGADIKPPGKKEIPSAMAVGQLIEKKLGSVDLKGRNLTTTEVLNVALADLIRPHLPALARLPRSWSLLYSLDQHGISLNTLYSRCETLSQTKPGAPKMVGALVIIKDSEDSLFGAWIGEGIKMSRGKGYYGSGESFLWKYTSDKLQVYKWTGRNDYVALCEPGFISFGGGDGQYGLYLDDSLYDGSSAHCLTYNNDPLCSPGPKKAGATSFECVGLEVWGIGP